MCLMMSGTLEDSLDINTLYNFTHVERIVNGITPQLPKSGGLMTA